MLEGYHPGHHVAFFAIDGSASHQRVFDAANVKLADRGLSLTTLRMMDPPPWTQGHRL